MADIKLNNYLLLILIIISCVMFVWTMNYVTSANDTQIQTTISAFNA